MTKRLAIFVEGQTEQIFVERLVREIAKEDDIDLHTKTLSSNRFLSLATLPSTTKPFFVLLYNCENDEKVKSVILEQLPMLRTKNYQAVIGLRDLHPRALKDLPGLKQGLAYGLPTLNPPCEIFIAVMETEAWFLQEKEHYAKIDPRLDYKTFKLKFGFDPSIDSAEALSGPPDLLKRIYRSVGKTYKKKRFHVQRTVDALDFAELCYSCSSLIPNFESFSSRLHEFFE
jgi:hypothetical protein